MRILIPETLGGASLPWGFSLFRVLVALFFVAVIEGGTILITDPWQQVATARNAQRVHDVNEIANAYYIRFAEYRGSFACVSGPIPLEPTPLQSSGGYDFAPCFVPEYLPAMPTDPNADNVYYRNSSEYRSGYWWTAAPDSGRIVVIAPHAELGATIQVER